MQNVVCPTTIVKSDKGTPSKLKKALSEMPVMIPGRASGSMNIRLTTSRPNHVMRWMANAANEPSTSASAVAISPTCSDRLSEVRTSASSNVELNHFKVRPGMGQLWMLEVLKAYRKIRRIGMNRNRRMSTTQVRSSQRVHKPSTSVATPKFLASSAA